jgi:AraC-like DNA-binding protein
MLDTFESVLASRLPRVRGLHPAVAMALARFHEGTAVADVVADSGYSHRRFLEVFREAAGLAPKVYCRVRRFQRALRRMASPSPLTWADLALESGFSDQAHFNREFLLLAGVTPGEYRKIAPSSPNHLPLKR